MHTKFCKDCKHMLQPRECAVQIAHTNLVTGYKTYLDCGFCRQYPGNACGPNGKLFEQKKPWWKLYAY